MITESKVDKVVRQILSGDENKISRWDVLGRFHKILQVLRREGKLEDWMYDHLQLLNDTAKDSL